MTGQDNTALFEEVILPHLDAAYNYARWIVRNDTAAQDIVQESCLNAFKGLHRFSGGNARAWLLTIVRHESYDWLSKSAEGARLVNIDAEETLSGADQMALGHETTPELEVMHLEDRGRLEAALAALPPAFREVLVLKELEDMSYRDISGVTGAPLGTVMSRLSRGRKMLKDALLQQAPATAKKTGEAYGTKR